MNFLLGQLNTWPYMSVSRSLPFFFTWVLGFYFWSTYYYFFLCLSHPVLMSLPPFHYTSLSEVSSTDAGFSSLSTPTKRSFESGMPQPHHYTLHYCHLRACHVHSRLFVFRTWYHQHCFPDSKIGQVNYYSNWNSRGKCIAIGYKR